MKFVKLLLALFLICACQGTPAGIPGLVDTPSGNPSAAASEVQPSPTHTPSQTPFPAEPSPESDQAPVLDAPLKITVLYDNIPCDQDLETAWGYSALIEQGDDQILFDTGGDGSLLLRNILILKTCSILVGE